MPITDDVYSVYLDGRPIQRAMTKAAAYKYADYFAKNVCRLKASDKRRAPELSVKLDKEITKSDDELYKYYKQGA